MGYFLAMVRAGLIVVPLDDWFPRATNTVVEIDVRHTKGGSHG